MITNKDIICISSIDWDFVWQGHQEIMSAFAKHGNRVLYIENTGIRTPRFTDIRRLKHRVKNWRRGVRGIRQESENLFVCSPLILPFPYSRIAKLVNRFLLTKSINAWMKAINFENPIIWTFLPTSISVDIIDTITNSLVVYYCIAEFAELADSSKKVEKYEAELLRRCDIVFAQGREIKERCQRYNQNVHIFPFGVNEKIFDEAFARKKSVSCSTDSMESLPGPKIGYIGGIHRHIDTGLLKGIAKKASAERPEWSIELVGPMQIDENTFREYKNIHLHGKKNLDDLPSYILNFDVCLIPYLLNEYTKTVYPTKLNEYLAMGKPVISTPIPEVLEFTRQNKGIIEIADSAESFFEKIDKAIKTPSDRETIKKRREIALRSNWSSRIEKMSSLMEETTLAKEKAALTKWRENFAKMLKITKKRILKLTSVAVIFYILLFHTPLVWWVASPLKVRTPLAKADVIIVLGGGVGETGRAGQGYEERVEYATELYKEGYAGKIIFSSGFKYAFQEADVMKALAVSLGVDSEDIELEKNARNTYENVKFSFDIARKNGYGRIIFVSSPYHMLRLKLTAEKLAPQGDALIFSPTPRCLFYGNEKKVTVKIIKAILHEYLGILYYKVKGYA